MDDFKEKENLTVGEKESDLPEEKVIGTVTMIKKKPNIYVIIAIITVVLVGAIAILTALYLGSRSKEAELLAAVEEAEEKLQNM